MSILVLPRRLCLGTFGFRTWNSNNKSPVSLQIRFTRTDHHWPVPVSRSQAENHFPFRDKTTAAFAREERRQSSSDIDPALEPNNEIRTKWNGVCEWSDCLGTKRQGAVSRYCGLMKSVPITEVREKSSSQLSIWRKRQYAFITTNVTNTGLWQI